MIESMNKDAIVFAMANPEPEINPNHAKEAGARIVGTGRSDYLIKLITSLLSLEFLEELWTQELRRLLLK
jgi:malic enzyme